MDDTYDWMGKNSPIKNNTTYGQVHNNFTAGVAGSVYNTVDTVTSPKYLAAKVYSVAAHPGRTLASINISGRDVARGLQGVAGKIKNKEYGSVARSAGYVAGSVAQAYGLSKGIEKCGDLINRKKYGTNPVESGSVSASKIGGANQTVQNLTRDDIINALVITSRTGEYAAYSAERLFQIESGMPVEFLSEEDMLIHIWRNYR